MAFFSTSQFTLFRAFKNLFSLSRRWLAHRYTFEGLSELNDGEKMKGNGTLIFFCGKMGAGKSTKSKQLAHDRNAVLMSEDEWLASLYPDQITFFEEYIKFSGQLKPLVKAHVQSILCTGTDVVMDFPANTVSQRKWFKAIFSEINAPHELIYLNISDEICLKQIAQRSIEQPERATFDTEEVFHQVTSYFEEPSADEGFKIYRIECSV